MVDENDAATIRRLDDIRNVIKAIAVASILLTARASGRETPCSSHFRSRRTFTNEQAQRRVP